MIETGYKPEFGLGAVYQGFNAANADMSAQEELIKQFLANQREQSMQPLDIEKARLGNIGLGHDNTVKALQAEQATVQNTPAMLEKFRQNTEAGYNKNIRQDELDSLMQPFKKDSVAYQGQTLFNQARQGATLAEQQASGITGTDSKGNVLSPLQKKQVLNDYNTNVGIAANTPEHLQKLDIEDTKGWWHLKAAQTAAEATRYAASQGGKAAWAQALPTVFNAVKDLQDNLVKLNNNELGDQIAQRIRAQGISAKKGTPEYEAAMVSEKQRMIVEYQTALQSARENYNMVLQASGLTTGNPVAASTNSRVSGSGSARQGAQVQPTFNYVPGQGLVPNQ